MGTWVVERKQKRKRNPPSKQLTRRQAKRKLEAAEQVARRKVKRKGQVVPPVKKALMPVRACVSRGLENKEAELQQRKAELLLTVQALQTKEASLGLRWQIRERRHVQEELQTARQELQQIEDGTLLEQYKQRVSEGVNTLRAHSNQSLEDMRLNMDGAQESKYSFSCVESGKKRGSDVYKKQLAHILNDTEPMVLSVYTTQSDMCTKCRVPMMILGSDSLLACPKCKRTRVFIQATSSRIAYGEEVEFTSFSYKRENHFQEWLNCFQAKESTVVPDDVLLKVCRQLWRIGVKSSDSVTTSNVRDSLKVLSLSKYYENTQQITSKLSGKSAPRMTPQQEEQVRLMFRAIQEPFTKHCPHDRQNFLSYGYCLIKFCELMGWDHYLPCFSLLKGADKLKKQDMIFEGICADLQWSFISSEHTIRRLHKMTRTNCQCSYCMDHPSSSIQILCTVESQSGRTQVGAQ